MKRIIKLLNSARESWKDNSELKSLVQRGTNAKFVKYTEKYLLSQ